MIMPTAARLALAFRRDRMDLQHRNNVTVLGDGQATLIFSHGFGCDQTMWNYLYPHFTSRFRIVMYDLVGAGQSDLAAYSREKYSSLTGYAQDLNEIIERYAVGPVILVGHSVSAMIGALADRLTPGRIAGHVMVGPSPCYIDSGDYVGGFKLEDIHSLLDTLDSNYLGWSSTIAPLIMGNPERPQLGDELTASFCATDPKIAKEFAKVTFFADCRDELKELTVPSLTIQCSSDILAPIAVGNYIHTHTPLNTLTVLEATGHCPHLSAPDDTIDAIYNYIKR